MNFSSSPTPSSMDMTLWVTNTSSNILNTLISEMEIRMISDTHILFNERRIKHKYKDTTIQHSHFSHNIEILLNNFQSEFRSKVKDLLKEHTTQLTLSMKKIKQKPQLFIHDHQYHTPLIPRNILQISSHYLIYNQLKDLQKDLVFIDTETDGILTHKSNILSLCMTTINLKESCIQSPNFTEHSYYIKPSTNYTVDTTGEAFKVNKISQTDLDTKGSPLPSISPQILQLLNNKIVVGFNINSFDIPIIRNNLKRFNIILPPLMTIDLYQAHHKLIRHDLNSALRDLKCYPIAHQSQHSANADTESCIRLLAAFTKKLNLPTTKQHYLSQYSTSDKHQIFQTNK
jgi:uncharacterized protein YprB with RNaseH-like and TPR domain